MQPDPLHYMHEQPGGDGRHRADCDQQIHETGPTSFPGSQPTDMLGVMTEKLAKAIQE